MPLYLTEFGYQTAPPDPTGVSLKRQASYLNVAEYLAARNPAVQTLTQFLLDDDRPLPGPQRSARIAYGSTFQTGLQTDARKRKPAYSAYRLPVHLPRRTVTRGSSLRVWGLVRPAPAGEPIKVRVQTKTRRKRSRWRTIKTVTVANARHYVDTRVKVRTTGYARLQWAVAPRKTLTSRAAPFVVKAKKNKR